MIQYYCKKFFTAFALEIKDEENILKSSLVRKSSNISKQHAKPFCFDYILIVICHFLEFVGYFETIFNN